MLIWRNRPWHLRAAVLVLAAAMVALLQWRAPGLFERIDQQYADLVWRLGAEGDAERRVVVVDIDETSLKEVGPWPWSRQTIAQLSQRMQEAGAVVQVYDVFFPEARDGDEALAAAWAQSAVVAGQLFSLDREATPRVGKVAGGLDVARCPPIAAPSYGYYGNASSLAVGGSVGHLSPRIESDGVVRRIPALVCHEGRVYPMLALAGLWRAAQSQQVPQGLAQDWRWTLASEQAYGGSWLTPAAWLHSASLPGMTVPVDERGDMIVPYRQRRSAFASVSASEVIRGGAGSALLTGAIAVVGASALGIGDTVSTPHAPVAAGVEVQVQALVGLLDHRVPAVPVGMVALQVIGCLLVSGLLLTLVRRGPGVPAKRLPIAGLVLMLACAAAAGWGQLQADLMLSWSPVALYALLAASLIAAAEHAITRLQRERLSAHLGAYLPQPVARRLMATDPSGSVQVLQRDITVLVADIRNFSAYAAHKQPQETAALLHAFSCIAVDVVEQHGGVVENVVGDSILAVWNAYSDCADHPRQALLAAQELLRATRTLLAPTQLPHEHSPLQPLALGVGIESGTAVVGSFGPVRRRAHAALGEPVSVASRLQQMTLDLSIPVLVGPSLAARLPAADTEALGDYLLEGLGRQYTLYAPVAWAELVPTELMWAHAASAADTGTGDEGAEWTTRPGSGPGATAAGAGAQRLRTLGDA